MEDSKSEPKTAIGVGRTLAASVTCSCVTSKAVRSGNAMHRGDLGMNLLTEPYRTQLVRWPNSGRHILSQFDDESVIVYQANTRHRSLRCPTWLFRRSLYSLSRMSWIKSNFLWMMYRSDWASKEGQEVVLAVRLKRSAFDEILRRAVHSTFVSEVYESESAWKAAVGRSDVRLQRDPDHNLSGAPVERRAIQLGLRGEVLAKYAMEWLLGIEDVSEFVREEGENSKSPYDRLITPREEVYPVNDPEVAARLGVASG